MSPTVLLGGQQGVGVHPFGSDYPFVKPSDDIKGLIVDAALSYAFRDVKLPLRLKYVYGLGPQFSDSSVLPSGPVHAVHPVDIWIVDADDNTVFDSVDATYYAQRQWSDRFKIHRWQTDNGVASIVQRTAFSELDDVRYIPLEIEPENGILDERVGHMAPERINSISVDANTLAAGNLDLVAGYNADLVLSPQVFTPGGRFVRQATINLEPGGGLGRFPGCEDTDLVIRSLNGIPPNAQGGAILSATDCYWISVPGTLDGGEVTPTPASLQLHNDCSPCCQCEDYVNVYTAMSNLVGIYRKLGVNASQVRDDYSAMKERWNDDKVCRANGPLRLHALARRGGLLDITISYCNFLSGCRGDLTITIEFSYNVSGQSMAALPDYAFIQTIHYPFPQPYTLTGDWPEYVAYWDQTEQGKASRLRFVMQAAHPADGDVITITVTAVHATNGTTVVSNFYALIP